MLEKDIIDSMKILKGKAFQNVSLEETDEGNLRIHYFPSGEITMEDLISLRVIFDLENKDIVVTPNAVILTIQGVFNGDS